MGMEEMARKLSRCTEGLSFYDVGDLFLQALDRLPETDRRAVEDDLVDVEVVTHCDGASACVKPLGEKAIIWLAADKVDNYAEAMMATFGHEFAHIVLGHVGRRPLDRKEREHKERNATDLADAWGFCRDPGSFTYDEDGPAEDRSVLTY
jgi:hypothetical protein